jgi:hypothetical protein
VLFQTPCFSTSQSHHRIFHKSTFLIPTNNLLMQMDIFYVIKYCDAVLLGIQTSINSELVVLFINRKYVVLQEANKRPFFFHHYILLQLVTTVSWTICFDCNSILLKVISETASFTILHDETKDFRVITQEKIPLNII